MARDRRCSRRSSTRATSCTARPSRRTSPTGRVDAGAAMAHVLTDEAFALAIAHFRRIGRADVRGYWIGAIVSTFIPWNVATLVGVTIGGSIPDPTRFGLDVIFPAAMGGLADRAITGPPRARGGHRGSGDRRRRRARLGSRRPGSSPAACSGRSLGHGRPAGPERAPARGPAGLRPGAGTTDAVPFFPQRAGTRHDEAPRRPAR